LPKAVSKSRKNSPNFKARLWDASSEADVILGLTSAIMVGDNPPHMEALQKSALTLLRATQRRDGTVPVEDDIRRLLRNAMKGRKRAEVAEGMSRLVGRHFTTSMLADFTRNGNGKRQVRFPLAWASAFCAVTGDDSLQRHVLSETLREALELGEWLRDSAWIIRRVNLKFARSPKGMRNLGPGRRKFLKSGVARRANSAPPLTGRGEHDTPRG
jgi:hypothetical protein